MFPVIMIAEILFLIHFFAKIYIMKLSAKELLNKFSKNISHSFEVQRLALIIFDETSAKIKEMPEKCREYLKAGALLHDIGYFVDEKNHNKHSMNMVLENGISGFDETEIKIIACICRYHRGGLPDKNEHDVYNTLDKKERKIVKRLAGILKISDGLNSGQKSFVQDIKLNFDEANRIAEFILIPKTPEYLSDISRAIRKRDLYEIGFKCQSVIKWQII